MMIRAEHIRLKPDRVLVEIDIVLDGLGLLVLHIRGWRRLRRGHEPRR